MIYNMIALDTTVPIVFPLVFQPAYVISVIFLPQLLVLSNTYLTKFMSAPLEYLLSINPIVLFEQIY